MQLMQLLSLLKNKRDKTYKRDKLLKIPKDTIKITDTTKPNVIKQATKQHKQHLILKADDIKEENIIEGKRTKNTTKNYHKKNIIFIKEIIKDNILILQ
jgi:hypothetical protein